MVDFLSQKGLQGLVKLNFGALAYTPSIRMGQRLGIRTPGLSLIPPALLAQSFLLLKMQLKFFHALVSRQVMGGPSLVKSACTALLVSPAGSLGQCRPPSPEGQAKEMGLIP
jgi:hypothetical protein